MERDSRFCSVCQTPLLKQDKFGYVLVLRCDQCPQMIHERCYLEHHIRDHELIAIITEQIEEQSSSISYIEKKDIIEFEID